MTTLIARIEQLMRTDDTDDSLRLALDYAKGDKKEREAIDNALISICGYSLATLLSYCKCEQCSYECAHMDLEAHEKGLTDTDVSGAGKFAGLCPQCGGRSFMLAADSED